MSTIPRKKIYLVGSLRNPKVPTLAEQIRDRGFEVFDDWYGAGHEADDMWQAYENGRKRNYRDALAGHAAQHIFNFDKKHILASDGIMLVLPAGKSGHLEFGFAIGNGKPGVILLDGEPERFDLMYNFANMVTSNLDEACGYFHDYKKPKSISEGTAATIEAMGADLRNTKNAAKLYLEALANISYSNAQNGEDAMKMRLIATKVVNPQDADAVLAGIRKANQPKY